MFIMFTIAFVLTFAVGFALGMWFEISYQVKSTNFVNRQTKVKFGPSVSTSAYDAVAQWPILGGSE